MSAPPFFSSTRFVLMMALLSGLTALGIDMVLPTFPDLIETFNIPEKVKYTIDEIIKGKTFKMTFSQNQKSDEAYSGLLILKTNYKDKPTLRILVRSRFD